MYLAPHKNFGTAAYTNKKGDNETYISWKPNKAFIFSRVEGETWHNFHSDGISGRRTLIYNLQVDDDNRAFRNAILKAEGKFFKTLLKEKLVLYPYRVCLKFFDLFGARGFIKSLMKSK